MERTLSSKFASDEPPGRSMGLVGCLKSSLGLISSVSRDANVV
jgi:hypothetical protein